MCKSFNLFVYWLCGTFIGFLIFILVAPFAKVAEPFWWGGETLFVPIISFITLFAGAFPSYKIVLYLFYVKRIKLSEKRTTVCGFLQGMFFIPSLNISIFIHITFLKELHIHLFNDQFNDLIFFVIIYAILALLISAIAAATVMYFDNFIQHRKQNEG